jgi:hypothetical protein
MDYLLSWLTLSGLGMLFGLFPGYANTAGILYEAILAQRKKPAKWLYEVFLLTLRIQKSPFGPEVHAALVKWPGILQLLM